VTGRQGVCPREVVTYTCTVIQSTLLEWTAEPFVPSSSRVRFIVGTNNEGATVSCSDFTSMPSLCTDIDFLVTLTSVGCVQGTVADLTSTFVFTATARLNGSRVQCSGNTAGGMVIENDTLSIAGEDEIIESVDSICRDSMDMQYKLWQYKIISQNL